MLDTSFEVRFIRRGNPSNFMNLLLLGIPRKSSEWTSAESASIVNQPQESRCCTSKADCMLWKRQMTAATRIPLSDVRARESHEATDVTQSLAPIKRKSKELPRMGSFSCWFYRFCRAWRAFCNNTAMGTCKSFVNFN